jgi:uncharacterized damage-inducible protein DinB
MRAASPRSILPFLAVLVSLATPLGAQSANNTGQASEVSDVIRTVYRDARQNMLAAARLVSPADYSYRPRPDVRSFGQLVAHVADAQYFFCAAGRGVANPNEPNHKPGVVAQESLEARLADKDEIVQALEAAFAFCDPVFDGVVDTMLDAPHTAAMQGRPMFQPLMLSLYHTAGHHGNMVTYLRQLGYTPPSSGP